MGAVLPAHDDGGDGTVSKTSPASHPDGAQLAPNKANGPYVSAACTPSSRYRCRSHRGLVAGTTYSNGRTASAPIIGTSLSPPLAAPYPASETVTRHMTTTTSAVARRTADSPATSAAGVDAVLAKVVTAPA